MISDISIANRLALDTNSGYWKINGQYFFNKAECLRYATSINREDITYHFFDDIFDLEDWSAEPPETLSDLYKQRAQQIRDKYGYLILFFSGGGDSTNVLNSFLNNNIHIDEIVSFFPLKIIEKLSPQFSINDTSPGNNMFEYITAVEPKLKEVAQRFPNIKITVVDYTEEVLPGILNSSIYKSGQSGLITNVQFFAFGVVMDRIRMYKNKNIGIVVGQDKPKILYNAETNRYGTYFADRQSVVGHFVSDVFDGHKFDVELFYYGSDCTAVTKKQCFEIKKVFEENKNRVLYPVSDQNGHLTSFWVHCDLIKKIIYPDLDYSNIFQAKKPESIFYMEHGNWLYNKSIAVPTRYHDYYDAQISDFTAGVGKHFVHYKNNKPSQFRNFFTKIRWF